jgi:hypothetical protein
MAIESSCWVDALKRVLRDCGFMGYLCNAGRVLVEKRAEGQRKKPLLIATVFQNVTLDQHTVPTSSSGCKESLIKHRPKGKRGGNGSNQYDKRAKRDNITNSKRTHGSTSRLYIEERLQRDHRATTIERSPANFTESIIEAIRSAKPGTKIGEVVALRDVGRPKKENGNVGDSNNTIGNTNEYFFRRLARDNPELLNKIESGELTVNQAATTIERSPVIDDSCRQAGRFQAVFSGFAICSFSNVFASVFFQNH